MRYTQQAHMEPMFPTEGELDDLAVEVIRQSSAIGGVLHPVTRQALAELVRVMNSFYSNLIEGHRTHPADIEKALRKDYSSEPAQRALQLESAAHVEVQQLIESCLGREPETDICAPEFLKWIHSAFYERLPEEFHLVEGDGGTTSTVTPGSFRKRDVVVGRHVPPVAESIPQFMGRFSQAYGGKRLGQVRQVIAAAASHHRLAWIHPFLDGNGRVTRLFTHAFLKRARIDGHGIWTVSRGFARGRSEYLSALMGADAHRQGDLDGRGNLSERGLTAFCRYFLETALDQIGFMSDLLDLDGVQRRISGYSERQAATSDFPTEGGYMLREVFLRGEMPRGEASRVTGKPERTARRVLKHLLDLGLLTSDTPKGPVRMAFPFKVASYYFPRLYPDSVEML